jgi:hypothetical protein
MQILTVQQLREFDSVSGLTSCHSAKSLLFFDKLYLWYHVRLEPVTTAWRCFFNIVLEGRVRGLPHA